MQSRIKVHIFCQATHSIKHGFTLVVLVNLKINFHLVRKSLISEIVIGEKNTE